MVGTHKVRVLQVYVVYDEMGEEIPSSTSFIQMDEILSSIDKFLIFFFYLIEGEKIIKKNFHFLFDWWMLYVTSTEINRAEENQIYLSRIRDSLTPEAGRKKKKQIHLILILHYITKDFLFHFLFHSNKKRNLHFHINGFHVPFFYQSRNTVISNN